MRNEPLAALLPLFRILVLTLLKANNMVSLDLRSFLSDLTLMTLSPVLTYVTAPWVEWHDSGDNSGPS